MANVAEVAEPRAIARTVLAVTRGVAAGWVAGIPQVAVTQIEAHLLGVRERAEIGTRFIARAAQHDGRPLPPSVHSLLGGAQLCAHQRARLPLAAGELVSAPEVRRAR